MIRIEKLTQTYCLNDINCTLPSGKLIGIMGANGAGKSTLLNVLAGLQKNYQGLVQINGANPSPKKQTIGFIPQNYGLLPWLTVKENILLGLKIKKEAKQGLPQNLVDNLGLSNLLNRYPNNLSGGQQQRIGVIRAIATDADIILMDEPFSALDPITRTQLQEWLYELQQELKKTIIFVTHDMDEALKLADKICIMQGGKIQQYDTAENLLKHPANSFVKDFIGSDRLWSAPEYIKAKDIMIKDPVKAIETRTVIQVMEIMRTNKVDSILVTDKNNLLVGILTVKELRQNGIQDYYIYKVMNKNPLFIYDDCNLIEILNIMNKENVGHIPVVSKDRQLVGLITRSSLLSVLSEQFLEMEVSILD